MHKLFDYCFGQLLRIFHLSTVECSRIVVSLSLRVDLRYLGLEVLWLKHVCSSRLTHSSFARNLLWCTLNYLAGVCQRVSVNMNRIESAIIDHDIQTRASFFTVLYVEGSELLWFICLGVVSGPVHHFELI